MPYLQLFSRKTNMSLCLDSDAVRLAGMVVIREVILADEELS